MNKFKLFCLALITVLFISCTKEPKPISYNEDECEFCKMLVMDKRYGAEIISAKGKIYFFDSIECLVGYINNKKMTKDDFNSLWVSNYADPGNIIDAEKAIYLKNDSLRSPMGLNVLAVENDIQLEPIFREYSGIKLRFRDVINLVREM